MPEYDFPLDARVKVNLEDETIKGPNEREGWPRTRGQVDSAIAFLALIEIEQEQRGETLSGISLREMVRHPFWAATGDIGARKNKKRRTNADLENLRSNFRKWQAHYLKLFGTRVFLFNNHNSDEESVSVDSVVSLQPYVYVLPKDRDILVEYVMTARGLQRAKRQILAAGDRIGDKLALNWSYAMGMARIQFNAGRVSGSSSAGSNGAGCPSVDGPLPEMRMCAVEILESFLEQYEKELGEPRLSIMRLLLAEVYIAIYRYTAATHQLELVKAGPGPRSAKVRADLLSSQMDAVLVLGDVRKIQWLESEIQEQHLGLGDQALFHLTIGRAIRRECVTAFYRDIDDAQPDQVLKARKRCEEQLDSAKRHYIDSLHIASRASRPDLVELNLLFMAELLLMMDTLKGNDDRRHKDQVALLLRQAETIGHMQDKKEDVFTLVLKGAFNAIYERSRSTAIEYFERGFKEGIANGQISLAANAAMRHITQLSRWAVGAPPEEVEELKLAGRQVYQLLDAAIEGRNLPNAGAVEGQLEVAFDPILLKAAKTTRKVCRSTLDKMGVKL